MKKIKYKLASFLFIISYLSISQNVGINSTGANPHPSALLDVDASPNNNTGVLMPRIALTSVALAAPVTSPATSLLVYNTASANTGTNAVRPGYYYWDGTKWVSFASGTAWDVLGNTGTNASTNFLGTIDNNDLVFRSNNIERIRVLANNGNTGIGTSIPNALLDVAPGGAGRNSMRVISPLSKSIFSNYDNDATTSFDFGGTAGSTARIVSIHSSNLNQGNDYFSRIFDVYGHNGIQNVPALTVFNNSRVGVNITTPNMPRGLLDVLNGDVYVADNIYAQNSFNLGRSATSVYADNIKPYTDNGFRVYDGNSNSHLRLEAVGQCQIQAYTTTGSTPQLMETSGTEGILSLNPTGGGVRVGLANGLSTTINPALPDNPLHRLTVGSGYFVAGNYNSDPIGGQDPGTTWINGVGGVAIGMNRNSGRSHVDLWNTSDVNQVAANNNIDRGFEFRGYDNAYAQRIMARIDGIGQFFSNGAFAISDKRFKSNIVPFNEKVLVKLMQVKTYNYQMHQPVSKNGGPLEKGFVVNEKDFGVLVQELYDLFPSVVYKPKDENKETWSVDYSRFGLYLLQGMKEQQEIINKQKTEIEQLNDKHAELLNRISRLENKSKNQ